MTAGLYSCLLRNALASKESWESKEEFGGDVVTSHLEADVKTREAAACSVWCHSPSAVTGGLAVKGHIQREGGSTGNPKVGQGHSPHAVLQPLSCGTERGPITH